jgi:hypothetical protein
MSAAMTLSRLAISAAAAEKLILGILLSILLPGATYSTQAAKRKFRLFVIGCGVRADRTTCQATFGCWTCQFVAS